MDRSKWEYKKLVKVASPDDKVATYASNVTTYAQQKEEEE